MGSGVGIQSFEFRVQGLRGLEFFFRKQGSELRVWS